jgi:hypothetical protein
MGDMSHDPVEPSMRVGSTERDAAVSALNVHREAGRLTSENYEDRSVRAGQARTWADLEPLFADLPEPRPSPVQGVATARPSGAPPQQSGGGGVVPERWGPIAMGLAPLVALVLFFTLHSWLWFLLVPIVSVLVYGGWGHGGHGHRGRDRR